MGEKQGIVDTSNITVTGGQRTGACVTTTQTYGPGSFEAVMKLPAFNGICTSLWLFNYISREEGTPDSNYEIDIEVHGTTLSSNNGNLSRPVFSTYLTESIAHNTYKDVGYNLADGKFHTFRIDWHTGANPRVEYYIDNVLVHSYTDRVPTNEMYVNIGCWFPYNWCGQPNFETDYAVVKSFSYTPFEGETATKEGSTVKTPGGFKSNVAIPEYNLLANGSFNYDITQNNAWTASNAATVENGNITFTGTISQEVCMDCLGNSYDLSVQTVGEGTVTVTVTYMSLLDSVTVTGQATGTSAETLHFQTPANCTKLLVEISSDTQVTVSSATLTVVPTQE